jgi:hypothetical protein
VRVASTVVARQGADALVSPLDKRMKWLLVTVCAIGFAVVFVTAADIFGLGGRPWFGNWDAGFLPTDKPFVVAVVESLAGGASAKAGLREGDRIDLRKQQFDARVRLLGNPIATQATRISLRRGARTLSVSVAGSSVWDGNVLLNLSNPVLGTVADFWLLACALLIAVRRWRLYEARLLVLILVCLASYWTGLVFPNATATVLESFASTAVQLTGLALIVVLSSHFGASNVWRRLLELIAYALIAVSFLSIALLAVGLLTLAFDPLPYVYGSFWVGTANAAAVAVVLSAFAAVASTGRAERSRSAWLLLPLPVAAAGAILTGSFAGLYGGSVYAYGGSLYVNPIVPVVYNLFYVLGAAAVTYALLKRRVLDIGFIVSRTIVVAAVSGIVVIAFVLLERVLGSVLKGISHTTGLIANGALALGLGISLRYIHRRVDVLVDSVLFRKRYDDERALRDFSQEAAYVTRPDTLLDQTMEKIRRHTDARNAEILLEQNGVYSVERSFGSGVSTDVDENDPAILTLKTWHRPVDPHRYESAIQGALAFPLLARGRLLGVLLLGERSSGEIYAPDEVEALSQFAHGVGSALGALSLNPEGVENRLLKVQENVLDQLRTITQILADPQRPESPHAREATGDIPH